MDQARQTPGACTSTEVYDSEMLPHRLALLRRIQQHKPQIPRTYQYALGTLQMERREVLMMRKKNKVYLTLNLPERRLLIRGLLSFRNKVIARGIDTVDIDRLLKKII